MIRIQRTTEPEVLTKNKASWKTRYLKAVEAYNTHKSVQNKRNKEKAECKYNHPRIKSALENMCFGKCAYCESHIPHIGYGHIEHYKPKSKYPGLCFEWDNLLLGCEICNGPKYKGDKFPLIQEGGPFINPCDEDPDIFFEFEFDSATGTANVIPKNSRGEITEKEIGLNRSDLVTHRSQVVRKLAFFTLRAKDGDADALAELKRCMNEDEEYAAFARTFHRIFNLP
jgi:uncharacterized protein (TIGR02646 family)